MNSILLSHSLLKASVPSLPIFLTQYQIVGLNISDKTPLGTQRCGCSCAFVRGRVSLCVPRAVRILWREKFTFCRKCKSNLQAWGGCTYRHPQPHVRASAEQSELYTAELESLGRFCCEVPFSQVSHVWENLSCPKTPECRAPAPLS